MSVVATSVFLLFALIVLGFILGKRNIIHKESIPDLSALVLQVTMPVTVFCSGILWRTDISFYYSFAFVCFVGGSDSDSCGKGAGSGSGRLDLQYAVFK